MNRDAVVVLGTVLFWSVFWALLLLVSRQAG